MIDITQFLVGGIPLLVVIFGLVEFIKSFGLKGNWLTGASLFLSLVFGFAYDRRDRRTIQLRRLVRYGRLRPCPWIDHFWLL